MAEATSVKYLWPYVLFLPTDSDARDDFIRSVLASRVSRSVLSSFSEHGQVLQRDLIENLNHSNKSILSYLKALNRFGLIRTSSTTHKGKHVVTHELTKNGWGLARFYSEGLPSDIEALTAFLLEDYLTRLTTIYRDLDIPESRLFDIFARTRAKAILDGSKKYLEPDVVVFGALAYNTRIECSKLPPSGGLVSCSSPDRSPGGPTVELATALASEQLEVSLISSVGNDLEGWEIINHLIRGDVDVSNVIVEEGKSTNESIIITENTKSRMLVGVSPETSLSIYSPSQVPWAIVEKAKVVYIGELFVEVASAVAAYSKTNRIPVIYRCSVPFWEMGIDRLKPVLNQTDILLITNQVWHHLTRTMGPNPIQKIRKVSDASIIIKDKKNSYKLYNRDESEIVISTKYPLNEMTRWFVIGLLRKTIEGATVRESVEFGIQYESQRDETD